MQFLSRVSLSWEKHPPNHGCAFLLTRFSSRDLHCKLALSLPLVCSKLPLLTITRWSLVPFQIPAREGYPYPPPLSTTAAPAHSHAPPGPFPPAGMNGAGGAPAVGSMPAAPASGALPVHGYHQVAPPGGSHAVPGSLSLNTWSVPGVPQPGVRRMYTLEARDR